MLRRPLFVFARRLRRRQTRAEAKAWTFVRNRRLLGLKFRRQHPIDGCIVDFYCHELRLAIELDGWVHSYQEQYERDYARDAHLRSRGVTVVRIGNDHLTRERLIAAVAPLLGSREDP